MRRALNIKSGSVRATSAARRTVAIRGITLMEVLIAIFVLAVGLMGVAALLPVGKSQVQKGSVNQRATTLATKAFEALETHGITQPSNWMYANGLPFDLVSVREGVRYEMEVDGSSSNGLVMTIDFTPPAGLGPLLIFDPAFGLPWVCEFTTGDLQGERRRVSSYDPANGRLTFSGDVYLNTFDNNNNQIRQPGHPDAPFPTTPAGGDTFVLIRNGPFVVDPQYVAVQGSGGSFAGLPRVSVARFVGEDVNDLDNDNNTDEVIYLPMGSPISESVFVSSDDLVVKPADQNDELPRQQWVSERFDDVNEDDEFDSGIDQFNVANDDITGNNQHDLFLRRHFEGHFSWAAMFSPPEGGYTDRQYTVSIIVFHKRQMNQSMTAVTLDYGTVGTSMKYGGGDAILRTAAENAADRMDKLRPGQWILVSKTYAQAVADDSGIKHIIKAVPIYRWYRLTSVGNVYLTDPDSAVDASTNPYLCNVTLDGADWRTRQTFSDNTEMNVLGPTATAYLVDDVAAVFQRTIEVESLPTGEP